MLAENGRYLAQREVSQEVPEGKKKGKRKEKKKKRKRKGGGITAENQRSSKTELLQSRGMTMVTSMYKKAVLMGVQRALGCGGMMLRHFVVCYFAKK